MAADVGLPPGFVLDEPTTPGDAVAPPAGFVLDQPESAPAERPSDQKRAVTFDNPIYRTALEGAAAVNRGAVDIADFLTVDQINAFRQLLGKEPDVPTIRKMLESTGIEGNFMEPGLAKDMVRGAGETVPMAASVGGALRGAASQIPAAANTVTQQVIRGMGSSTALQDVGYGALSGAGSEVGEAVGGKPGAMVGAVAAPLLAAAPSALKESVRQIFRGGEAGRQVVAQSIDDFARAGSRPTVAEATKRPALQAIENISSRFIGGGAIQRARDATARNIRSRLAEIANNISTTSGDDVAGLAIRRAITGRGGFLDRFRATQNVMWGQIDDAIGDNAPIQLNRTAAMLDDLVSQSRIGQELNNPLIVRLRNAVDDAPEATYRDLRALRTSVGERLSNNDLISDVPRAQLRRLYGAISQDIEAAAANTGDDVLRQFRRANRFTAAGHDRIDDFLQGIVNKTELDKIFQAVTKGGEGSQTINAFKRSMQPNEWEVVVSNVVRKLGRATPGNQDAAADIFSVQKFLTDWNKLGPARRALFSGSPQINQYGRDLDAIARAAETIKFASKEAANPSGTGQFMANIGAVTTGAGAVVTGNVPLLGSVLTAVTANNLGSRLMTNPAFVAALARTTRAPSMSYAALLSGLNNAAKKSDVDDAVAIHSLMKELDDEIGGGKSKQGGDSQQRNQK